jgi:hypothetical protein
MSINSNTNMRARDIAVETSLPQDHHRTYLAIQAAGAAVTVTLSGGTPFTIPDGSWWGPQPAPMNDMTFTGTGTVITG